MPKKAVKKAVKKTTKKVPTKKPTKTRFGVEVILLGSQGMGKTTLLTYAPNPHFICDPNEQGIQRLIQFDNEIGPNVDEPVFVHTFTELQDALDDFADNPGDRKTLVLEGLRGIETLAKIESVKADYNKDEADFENYGTGWKTVESKYMTPLRRTLGRIKSQGIHVFITGHTVDKEKKNSKGPDYTVESAVATKNVWESWRSWAGGIWFLNKAILTGKDNPKDKRAMKKVRDASCWLLTNSFDNAFEAKDQYGMPAELDFSGSPEENWNLIAKHIGI